jgi:dTMP kinase
MSERGLFIVVEGIDGCGKSTQAMMLASWIFSEFKGVDSVTLTHEPTNSKFGKNIYARLQNKSSDESQTAKERMLELYVLDREQHVDTLIAPILAKKGLVICDRYKYSTIAYQSAQGVPMQHTIDENVGFPVPDVTLVFNINPETCVARMEKAGKNLDKFEKIAFLEKVKEQYLRLPTLLPNEKIQIINANQSIEQIHADVAKAVKPLLDAFVK